MLGTPSGVGDPKTVVCRAPQPIPGSERLGPQACLANSEWWKVAMNGKDVAPDGKSLIAKATVDNPTGEGDPDAVTCRTPRIVSRQTEWVKRYSPVICRPNNFWADAIKNHQLVDARGNVMARPMDTDCGPPYDGGGYPTNNNCGTRYGAVRLPSAR
jgi:hypothetical protein